VIVLKPINSKNINAAPENIPEKPFGKNKTNRLFSVYW